MLWVYLWHIYIFSLRPFTVRTCRKPENCGTPSWLKGMPNTPTCGWSTTTLKGLLIFVPSVGLSHNSCMVSLIFDFVRLQVLRRPCPLSESPPQSSPVHVRLPGARVWSPAYLWEGGRWAQCKTPAYMRLKLFPRVTLSLRVVSSPTGSLEDWDLAVQKTETRMNRINEQRAKVRAPHVARQRCICRLLLAHVTVLLPSVRQLKKKPSLLSKRKSEPTSGGRPSQRRKHRRRFRREFEPGRRGKQIRATIRTSGTKTPVSKDDETPCLKPETLLAHCFSLCDVSSF